jgi:serine/threonine protein phosphatase PrpC
VAQVNKYRSKKEILASKIIEIQKRHPEAGAAFSAFDVKTEDGETQTFTETWINKNRIKQGDYLVMTEDGVVDLITQFTFINKYELITNKEEKNV